MTTETIFACVPDAIPAAERSAHFALLRELIAPAPREALPDGYRLDFPANEFDRVARFVANERRCCPFLGFDIGVRPADDRVTLTIAGPPGAREFIDQELFS